METVNALSLRATYRHPRAREYRSQGGAWDVPTLDQLLGSQDTGSAFGTQVAALAGDLRARGVRRGSVVAWQLPNWPEVAALYRACWQVGAIAAPIHHNAGAADLQRMLQVLDPAVFLDVDSLRARVKSMSTAPPDTRSTTRTAPFPTVRPADLAVALFTAGTSGEPKAVLHTHRGLAHKTTTMVTAHGLTSSDVVLMPAPLAHISGLLNGLLVPGLAGMRSILMERWDPEEALATIERERVTFMVGPPTFFIGLMNSSGFTPERVASLRLVSSGGTGVTADFVAEASERLGAHVKRAYGSTEAPTIATSTGTDPAHRSRDSDGRVVGQAELRIASDGELLVRGPELFAGYIDADQTRAATTRGWFRTGDLANLNNGWLTITGRIKDVIIRGGENISAGEVEEILARHPSVREAVAVGYPDDRLGERVCAFVVASDNFDLQACIQHFTNEGIARFKTPERVVVLGALPVLGAGKVDRSALRDLARAGI